MPDNTIIDHIAEGRFDRELGEIVRDPKYAEYTAIEIKSILTDRIAERRYGLGWTLRVLAYDSKYPFLSGLIFGSAVLLWVHLIRGWMICGQYY